MSISQQQPYKITNFINDIVNNKIVQFNKTELSCGRTSSYYADFRQLLAYTELTNYVVNQIIKIIETLTATGESYNIIAGVAVAGVPWATLVGNKLNKPVSIIRLNEKTHGKKSAIDGAPIKFDDRVILIEDVLTTGSSVLKALRKITNTGASVVRVISILDRNEGAQEHIKYYFPDIKLSSILSIEALVSVCSANKLIPDYVAEQIEFYRENGYTDTIKMLTKLNEDAKEKPYQKDTVAWHIDNYKDVWNLSEPESNNALFVDVSMMTEWTEIKYKINTLGKKLHNLVIVFEKIKNWDEVKQEELIDIQNKYGFNIIYKSSECIQQSLFLDTTTYTIRNNLINIMSNCKYPNSVLTNGVILNFYVDSNIQSNLSKHLSNAIKNYDQTMLFSGMNIPNIFINFIGPGTENLITDREIWQDFSNYILSIIKNQPLQIKGLILPYSTLKLNKDVFLRFKDLSRLIPLILDASNPIDFYLEPTMLSDNPNTDFVESLYTITKVFNGNGFTHLMVGNDLMQSNVVIEERMDQYTKFMNTMVTTQKKSFSFMQMFNKAQSEMVNNTSKENVIQIKVKEFNDKKKNAVNKAQKNANNNGVTTTQPANVGLYDKCKGYLLTTSNSILGLFGLSLTTK